MLGLYLIHPNAALTVVPTLCVQACMDAIPREVSLSDILLMSRTLPARSLLFTPREMHGKSCHFPVNQKFGVFCYGKLFCPFSVFCWCHSRHTLIWSLTADHVFPDTSVYAALGSDSRKLRVFLGFTGVTKAALRVEQAMLLPSTITHLLDIVRSSSLFRLLIVMVMMVLLVSCHTGIIIKGNWCQQASTNTQGADTKT